MPVKIPIIDAKGYENLDKKIINIVLAEIAKTA